MPRRASPAVWYCTTGCLPQPHTSAWACRLCCGYTTNPDRWVLTRPKGAYGKPPTSWGAVANTARTTP